MDRIRTLSIGGFACCWDSRFDCFRDRNRDNDRNRDSDSDCEQHRAVPMTNETAPRRPAPHLYLPSLLARSRRSLARPSRVAHGFAVRLARHRGLRATVVHQRGATSSRPDLRERLDTVAAVARGRPDLQKPYPGERGAGVPASGTSGSASDHGSDGDTSWRAGNSEGPRVPRAAGVSCRRSREQSSSEPSRTRSVLLTTK